MDLHLIVLGALLLLTGLVAGLIDTVAGGGGMITIPVLLALGIPAPEALGTNKLQSSFGSGSATAHFVHYGEVRLGDCRRGIMFTALGAALGAFTVQFVPPAILGRLIPVLLVILAVYVAFSPRLGMEAGRPRMPAPFFYALAGLGIGFYDGFFGPGTGSFWAFAFVLGLGFDLRRATAHTKVMNFTSNIVSLLLFVAAGKVLWVQGLVMAVGQAIGGRLGSKLVVRRGARFVKPLLILMTVAVSAKLLWDAWG